MLPGVETIDEALQILDVKLKQLKHEYDQYFRGTRPREPVVLRGEVQKIVNVFSNTPIQNTAQRFRFNNLCARFFTFRRQWDTILRQIEEGTYKIHQFRASLHERNRGGPSGRTEPARGTSDRAAAGEDELYEKYVEARRACGEDTGKLDRERMRKLLEQQRSAIQKRYGCSDVRFRVVVEGKRAKLKASPVRPGERQKTGKSKGP